MQYHFFFCFSSSDCAFISQEMHAEHKSSETEHTVDFLEFKGKIIIFYIHVFYLIIISGSA